VTAYAVGVAMNNFLPANIGTFATLIMFTAIIPAATFAGRDRGLSRAEDLLHDRGHVRLPLPLPVRARLVQPRTWQHLRESGDDDHDLGRRRTFLIVILGPHLLEAGEEALGEGEAGRR
jgi:hypothetical protein